MSGWPCRRRTGSMPIFVLKTVVGAPLLNESWPLENRCFWRRKRHRGPLAAKLGVHSQDCFAARTLTTTSERTYFSLTERLSRNSNMPRRNSSPVACSGSVAVTVRYSVNAAFGNCSQIARSSAVTINHPNVNKYRPGSATRPTCAHVILLTANHFPFAFILGRVVPYAAACSTR